MSNNYDLILSKQNFYQNQFTTVKNAVTEKMNAYYADKNKSKKINMAKIGYPTGLSIYLVGLVWLLATFALSIYIFVFAKEGTKITTKDVYLPLLASFYSLAIAFTVAGGTVYFIARKAKMYLKKDIIKSFNNRKITDHLFKYFGLNPRYKTDKIGNKNISFNHINYFKNVHNFKELKHFNLVCEKYELYEALTNRQYFKMQNLLYRSERWKLTSDLDKKVLHKLQAKKAEEYKNKIQILDDKLRFGIAAKILNIDKDINITLFDSEKTYTPSEYEPVEINKKYEELYLYGLKNHKIDEWAKDENNLKYLRDLREQIEKFVVNVPVKKYKRDKKASKNIGLMLRNQEAFIWADIPFELLDLGFETWELNKESNIDLITNKILDDFYLIYLLMQLLAPFGYDLTLKISEQEIKKAEEKQEQDEQEELAKSMEMDSDSEEEFEEE